MKKTTICPLFLLAAAAALQGCKEDSYEDLVPGQYNKILYLKTYGEQTLNLFDDGSQVDYSLTVVKTGSDPGAVARGRVDLMTQAEIDADSRYQGNNYKVLSPACYTFRSEQLELSPSDTYRQLSLKMSPARMLDEIDSIQGENPDYVYIIPFRLSSESDQVNQERRDLILRLNVTRLSVYFKGASQTVDLNNEDGDEWDFEADIAMTSGVENTWEFTAQIEVDTREETLNAYNEANGTSYRMIPGEAVGETTEAVFEAGNTESVAAVNVRRQGLAKGYTYLIPLRIKAVEGMDAIVVNDRLHYIILEYPLDPEADMIELDESMLADPFSCGGGDGTTLAELVDNDVDTYYHTQYGTKTGTPEYGQPVDIALGKSVRSIQIQYVTRDNNNATPTRIKLFVSSDGESWEELADIRDGLPGGGKEEYKSPVFMAEKEFSHLRFSVMSSKFGVCDGQSDGDGSIPCWALAELNIWGSE